MMITARIPFDAYAGSYRHIHESDPNPNLARRNRSESEPGPAKPIRIRTWPGETDPNPNLAGPKPIRIRTQEKQSEPGACGRAFLGVVFKKLAQEQAPGSD